MPDTSPPPKPFRTAIVLSGGGARGAYEAGVLAYLFEHIYPELPEGFEFEIVSGTSIGAIHASYLAASADLAPHDRAQRLVATWQDMELADVLRLSPTDWVNIPLRALGVEALIRGGKESAPDLIGGLVDITPLERLVEERIPWSRLRGNLAAGRPRALCVSCTNIQDGRVTVFIDGEHADTSAWESDRYAQAILEEITPRHVRASAAIPFLFPAVRVGDDYYLDGGLRANTPLSPVLRMGADRVLVIGLKCEPDAERRAPSSRNAITQPAFVLGKMLNVLILDQIEHELRRVETINTILEAASDALGAGCLESIETAMREKRGIAYRPVETAVVRPSQDIGAIAADSYHRSDTGGRWRGLLPRLLAQSALHGVPDQEADLFSYLFFDSSFSRPLIELGREDAKAQHDEILTLLGTRD